MSRFEDYKGRFDSILTNPDTALGSVDDIYKDLEADFTTMDSLESEVGSLRDKVKELQETNIKLYLSRGGEVEETQEEETSDEEAEVEAFFEELNGEKKED